VSTSLPVSTGAISCYPASIKNIHRVSTKQHVGMKSGISRSKKSTFSQAVCAGAPSCWKV